MIRIALAGTLLLSLYYCLIIEAAGSQSLLPEVVIDTHGAPIVRRTRVPAFISVATSADRSGPLARMIEFEGKAAVAVRGSGSTMFPKKSYRVELQDEHGADKKVSLLGMPAESDWILLAAYTDRTLMRDALAYELWREMGYWAPR